jgi:hypothetical protein
MRHLLAGLSTVLLLALGGCGGGGDNNSQTSSSGGSGGSGGTSGSTVANQVTVTIGPNSFLSPNSLVTSVTLCVPGTSTCQTINNIIVDTGSFGLRVMASAVSVALPGVTASGGGSLAECAAFVSGTTWGPVRAADIKLAGETASSASVQIIGDSALPNAPSTCLSQGTEDINTAAALGANGILGIGLEVSDCPSCATTAFEGAYYNCTSATQCVPSTASLAQQVTNPVSQFATDNNGVIIQLPALATLGQQSASGTLTFGIGTQSNNGLGAAKIYGATTTDGTITTQYKGVTIANAYIDSGSNGLFFDDLSITQCPNTGGLFCPTSTQSLSALIQGTNGANTTVNFSVGNALALLNAGDYAMTGFAGYAAKTFDWGIPFFFGRTVYTAINGKSTPGGTGPYFAF